MSTLHLWFSIVNVFVINSNKHLFLFINACNKEVKMRQAPFVTVLSVKVKMSATVT